MHKDQREGRCNDLPDHFLKNFLVLGDTINYAQYLSTQFSYISLILNSNPDLLFTSWPYQYLRSTVYNTLNKQSNGYKAPKWNTVNRNFIFHLRSQLCLDFCSTATFLQHSPRAGSHHTSAWVCNSIIVCAKCPYGNCYFLISWVGHFAD